MSDLAPIRVPVRDAILEAALAVLAQSPRASLGAVAAHAGVGRATLHRHFVSRDGLVRELALHCVRALDDAAASVAADSTSAMDLLRRTIEVIVPLGDRFHFLALEGQLLRDAEVREAIERQLRECAELVAAAQREGGLDPGVPARWMVSVIDALTYAAWSAVAEGQMTASEAAQLVIRTLFDGLAPR